MITNIPSATDLRNSALRLHFAAWETLSAIEFDFATCFPGDRSDWIEEWQEYLEFCNADLQLTCATIAQSNELGLRAKIADVSPYLLLVGSEQKFRSVTREIDFSKLRTMDAVDLPNAVNAICSSPVSDKFVQIYNEARAIRNAVAHIGESNVPIHVERLVEYLIVQYETLWPDRRWLKDFAENSSKTRLGYFHNFVHGGPDAQVALTWHGFRCLMTKGQHLRLTGKQKSTRRYLCPDCAMGAGSEIYDLPIEHLGTAYLSEKLNLECLICANSFTVQRSKCISDDCRSTVLWKEFRGETSQFCLICAAKQ